MSFQGIESVFQDIRQIIRSFARTSVFAAAAIFSLALGIGASTSLFTATYTLLLRPMAVKEPSSLVRLELSTPEGAERQFLPLAFAEKLGDSGAFSDVIAAGTGSLSFSDQGQAERVTFEVVTPNYFRGLGITPLLGDGFSRSVVAGKWAPEAVISHSFWKARFGGDPHVIGRNIRLNNYPVTITGVLPAIFFDTHQGQNPDIRMPVLPPGHEIPQIEKLGPNQDMQLIARLSSGTSTTQAQNIANAVFRDFALNGSDGRYRQMGFGVVRLLPGARGWPALAEYYGGPVIIMFLLTLVSLLMACANVTSMTLARILARRREFAMRACLGAGRLRLLRLVVFESLVLSCAGGLLAIFVAHWVTQFLVRFLPEGPIRLVFEVQPEIHSILFTLFLCVGASLIIGVTTALHGTRNELVSALKADSNGPVRSSSRTRKALIVVQIASSLALLATAGLFMRTLFNLYPNKDYPSARNVIVFALDPPQEIYSPERIRSTLNDITERVSHLRGVTGVGIAENGPFSGRTNTDLLQVPGLPAIEVTSDVVGPGFLNSIDRPILSGRDFSALDKPGSPRVVILSQSAAKALFALEDPVGRSIQLPSARGTKLYPIDGIPVFKVIGMVPDAHYYNVRNVFPSAFFTFQADPPYMPSLHVRVHADAPDSFISLIRREFEAVDPGLPFFNVRTLESRIQEIVSRERMIAELSAAVGILALTLAAVGLYGLLAYSVSQRTHEIGVRIAIGSSTSQILGLVLSEGFQLVGIGVAIGGLLAVTSGRLLAHRLFGVGPTDPSSLFIATALLLVVSFIAMVGPAIRATGSDPANLLKHD